MESGETEALERRGEEVRERGEAYKGRENRLGRGKGDAGNT